MATSTENKTLSQFKSQLIGGGARPNLFQVELATLPDAVEGWSSEKMQYLCKAASLPASNIANIDIPFRGRIFKVAGDRTFDVWTVTVINDEDFILRNAFEGWMDQISKLSNNLGATEPNAYMVDATVHQLGRGSVKNSKDSSGEVNAILKSYKFIDIFPTAISAIDLSYDTGDAIEEFTVDFQVQTFELISGGANG
tara:strand:- start:647 stop:1237 length:591 start_codon:yes stop_codon:yes gene_type:complete